eukprot:scaffold2623_cov250-Pinguiococcus_pyrenoidosus.AAC.4
MPPRASTTLHTNRMPVGPVSAGSVSPKRSNERAFALMRASSFDSRAPRRSYTCSFPRLRCRCRDSPQRSDTDEPAPASLVAPS